jgi:hypothetical protein
MGEPKTLVVRPRVRAQLVTHIPGPPGPAGTGYTHTQSSPSATWTINHNLGIKPSVEVFSVGGLEVDASVLHVSNNQVAVSFATPFAGYARLV